VAFSEIEKFLDTPVKRYSSGMYVRLAFAVAAHLEPEILICDEVLAVGDTAFQKKCLGKMRDVAQSGRTVLLVTHNLTSIAHLCTSAILLDSGTVTARGKVNDCVAAYTAPARLTAAAALHQPTGYHLALSASGGSTFQVPVCAGGPLNLRLTIASEHRIENCALAIGINAPDGTRVVTLSSRFQTTEKWTVNRLAEFTVNWADCFLVPGIYTLEVVFYRDREPLAHWPNAYSLRVLEADVLRTGRLPDPRYQGYVIARASWTFSGLK